MRTPANQSRWLFCALVALSLAVSSHGAIRSLRAGNISVQRLQTNCLSIVLEAQGDENALGFSLCYDTNLLTYVSARRGTGAAGTSLNVNANQAASGRIGLALALPSGEAFSAGASALLEVCFRAKAVAGIVEAPVLFCDQPIGREVVGVDAGSLSANYSNAIVTVMGTCSYSLPTNSASVAGAGGAGAIQVTADQGCAWSATSAASWVTFPAGANGLGSGSLAYAVAVNPDFASRTGVVTVAGQSFTVSQQPAPCTYSLSAAGGLHSNASETGQVNVTTASPCGWTASRTNSWITLLAPANGTGNGTVRYLVATNPSSVTRTGDITIDGQSFTVSQTGVTCDYALPVTSRFHGSSSETGLVSVTAVSGCSWTAASTLSWILITSNTNGIGIGSVGYTILANPTTSSRTGVVMIAGQTFSVSQAGAVCAYTLEPTSFLHGLGTETGEVSVTAIGGCSWMVTTTNSWITIISSANRVGSGLVRYSVAPNPNLYARTGMVMIAGLPFPVIQPDAPCHYILTPSSRTHGPASESTIINVTAPAACDWTVYSTVEWMFIKLTTNGSGSDIVRYTVTANPNPFGRSGTLVVNGSVFTVFQTAAPCTYDLLETNQLLGSDTSSGIITLATADACAWTAVNTSAWIRITSPTSGMGGAGIGYDVSASLIGGDRVGVITVAGVPYTVTQFGTSCRYSVSPSSRSHTYAAANGNISVNTTATCPWPVGNTNSWITMVTPTNRNGNATVTYALAASLNPNSRSGVLSVAGQNFIVTQAGTPCRYALTQTSRLHRYTPEGGAVGVLTSNTCPWPVVNPNDWIVITSGLNGVGAVNVNYTVLTNPNPVMRTGIITVAQMPYTIVQEAAPCMYILSPASRSHGYNAENALLNLASYHTCAWTVSTTNHWITITSSPNGAGNATLAYTVAVNPVPFARSGAIIVGDRSFPITQAASPCTYSLTSTNQAYGPGAATGLVSVTTYSVCNWSVDNPNDWITVTTPSSNNRDSGTVRFLVAANPVPIERSGTLTIAGQSFTVSQSAAPCTYALSSTNRFHSYGSETGFVTLSAHEICDWRITNTNEWLSITSATEGVGTGYVAYALAANPIPLGRTGVVMVANRVLTISQLGSPCFFSLSLTNQSHGYAAETGQVSVATQSTCNWTVTSGASWITLLKSTPGATGDGEVSYKVTANPNLSPRTGVLTIAGQPFTINQAAAPCSFTISPTSRSHGYVASTATVSVVTSNVCPWSVITKSDWVTILSSNNLSGSGTVRYSTTTNNLPVTRSTILTIGNQPFTILQSAAPCTYSVSPVSPAHGFAGENGVINVTTLVGCDWTATTTNSWITFTSATNGSNSSSVNYQLEPNPGTARAGRMVIAGLNINVTQAATPPVGITTPPVSQSVAAGSTVNFSVIAIGAPPLTYQWRLNGMNLAEGLAYSGVARPNLTLFNVQPAHAGGYSVVVSNVRGSATSSPPAVLTINTPPRLAAIPNRTVSRGALMAFTATAIDDDLPAQTLRYSLDAGAPAGASIHVTNGLFTWTPPAVLAPGAYPVSVRVTDGGIPPLSGTRTMLIKVIDGFATNLTLLRTGAVWKYLDTGTNLGTAWVAPGYDDSAWASGRAKLGYGAGNEATVLGYGPDASAKYITTYFRTTFPIGDPALYNALSMRVLRDDGVLIYLNGIEVHRDNMPAGPVNYLTLASSGVGGVDESTYFLSPPVDPGLLVTCDNVLAIELHQRNSTGSDLGLDLELTGSVTLASPTSSILPALATAPIIGVTIDTSGTVRLVWNTCPGRSYRVQYTTSLSSNNWTDFGSKITAAGSAVSLQDSLGASPQRFYRILRVD